MSTLRLILAKNTIAGLPEVVYFILIHNIHLRQTTHDKITGSELSELVE